MPSTTRTSRLPLILQQLEPREVPAVGLDTAFGTDGTGFLIPGAELPGTPRAKSDLFTLSDGSVWAGGWSNYRWAGRADTDAHVSRVSGPTGTRFSASPDDEYTTAMAVTPLGAILVATQTQPRDAAPPGFDPVPLVRGYPSNYYEGASGDFHIWTANLNGVTGGAWTRESVGGLTVLSDGDFLVNVRSQTTNPADGTRTTLVRLNFDGSRDTAFGTNGVLQAGDVVFTDIAATANGGFVALSRTAGWDARLEKFTSTGQPDATFGTNGATVADLGGEDDRPYTVTVQPTGGLVVTADTLAADQSTQPRRPVIASFTSSGAHVRTVTLPSALTDLRVATMPDGRLVYTASEVTIVSSVPGQGGGMAYYQQVVGRLTAAGAHDTNFGSNGVVKVAPVPTFGSPDHQGTAADVVVQTSGRVVGLGVHHSSSYAFALTERPAAGSQPVAIRHNWGNDWFAGPGQAFAVAVRPHLTNLAPPTGMVTVRVNGQVVGSATVPADGLVNLTLNLPAGAAAVVIDYTGDGTYAPATESFNVFVRTEETTTTLAVSNMAPQLGEPVAITATVRTGRDRPAAGEVVFRDNGVELGRATTDASGVAALTDVRLRLGARAITAVFTPAPTEVLIGSTSPTVRLTVAKANSTAELTVTPTTVVAGSPVTFEARVRTATGIPAIGTVVFHHNDVVLGTATLNGNGVTRVTVTNVPVGTHWVSARYVGSSTVNASASPLVRLTVTGTAPVSPTTVRITTPRPSYRYGEQVRVNIAVTKGTTGVPEPTGYVSFFLNGRKIADGTLNPDGTTFFTTTAPLPGTMRLRVEHRDANLNLTGSAELAVTVGKQNTGVAFVTPPAVLPAPSSQPVTLAVRVSPENVGSPIGTVTLRVNGTALGTFAVNGNGIASVVFPRGYHRGLGVIRLEYGGSSVFNPSAFEVTV